MISTDGRLKDLILRQYVMKKAKSNSWITNIKFILQKYALPSVVDLISNCPSKTKWKKSVKNAIIKHVSTALEEDVKCKSTLLYLNPCFNMDTCHNVVSYISNPREVRRACVKSQMLTGTYPLQATRVIYRQAKSDICLLCGEGKEDLIHCLLSCPRTETVRVRYLPGIIDHVPLVYIDTANILLNSPCLTQLIMDNTHPSVSGLIPQCQQEHFEQLTRNLCFAIHSARADLLT
jgi:hypothetical protein